MDRDKQVASPATSATLTDYLDTTDTVTIVTRRANGQEQATPIWSVAAGGRPYVRSAFGPDSWWYRRAIARGLAAFPVGAESIPVRLEHIDDPTVIAAVDAAFSVKYADQQEDLRPVLENRARACTLLIVPA